MVHGSAAAAAPGSLLDRNDLRPQDQKVHVNPLGDLSAYYGLKITAFIYSSGSQSRLCLTIFREPNEHIQSTTDQLSQNLYGWHPGFRMF